MSWSTTPASFPGATLEETTEELWDRIFAVNLKGVFFCCRYAMPAMRERGGGSVINLGSTNAYVGGGNLFAYSISKGGLLTLTRNLAASWALHRVRVNFLNPGWVITPGEIRIQGLEGHDVEWLEEHGRRMPLGRMQTPRTPPGPPSISPPTNPPWSPARPSTSTAAAR